MKTIFRPLSRASLVCATAILVSPLGAFAARSGLVPCGNLESADGKTTDPCAWNDLIQLAKNIISWLIFYISVPLATVMFVYAGYLYLSAAGNEGQVKKAHKIFKDVLFGFIIALAAWLIVNFILDFLQVGANYRVLG